MNHEILSQPAASALGLSDAFAFVREQAGTLRLDSGEPVVDHALGVVRIIKALNVDQPTLIASVIFNTLNYITEPGALLVARFGPEIAQLAADVCKLMRLGVSKGPKTSAVGPQRAGRDLEAARRMQIEVVRKMLLAFAQDVRVVLIRLASRLQTLRYYAATQQRPALAAVREMLELDAPLANRLGIWQLKWELEDLAFRFEEPVTYKYIAGLLDEKRIERNTYIVETITQLQLELSKASIRADVSGRPKHIYSIWRKMRSKQLDFSELYDVRALRVIVDDIKDCYSVLGIVHNLWQPIPKEFDDYISRPKLNGYKSLHTVVLDHESRALEIQIRTHEMHRFAEYGVAAHWRYKETGGQNYDGQTVAQSRYDEKLAWLRQLLAWKDEVTQGEAAENICTDKKPWEQLKQAELDDHLYVLTPQAHVVALPQGSTAIDFAYYLHTELGHHCRGARIDGAMVPLNTPLHNGQTVEIIAVKQGGPSRDWLNPQLAYLSSARAKQKVRAWFNAIDLQQDIVSGRVLVEKTLQREGKTSTNLEELAAKLGFKSAEELFIAVSKEELSPRSIEQALVTPSAEQNQSAAALITRKSSDLSVLKGASSGVLVVGVSALMTHFARCCRPAPPDAIAGFVTRARGISIHRAQCASFFHLAQRMPERVMQTTWSSHAQSRLGTIVYPIDLVIEATDRPGLLRDISEVFAREKINVINVKIVSRRALALMHFTVEVTSTAQVSRAAALLIEVVGVLRATRKS
ncbi:bifunctional (p)ppGpp synthetase/guanosine-3',5'-bis(diphosphate) 3'-pyrophosphohydrolase [Mycoavidus sp. B2-EB]|uniref:RelA/SpoT family protein n=1 Tax=Mycoavidus sp. B2-EB TaxID=2651972 RepID=UPI001623FD50|nr:bifunctional (p)ppGpp synthetase/guanosine-3',5'-bis(diphosphate) 3'-pyrophosphohydrolase [Mycoavidus sp. B2-EB]BBO59894.1 GTP pyrophosphokinase [Mycoavidus sp. B2-EB]